MLAVGIVNLLLYSTTVVKSKRIWYEALGEKIKRSEFDGKKTDVGTLKNTSSCLPFVHSFIIHAITYKYTAHITENIISGKTSLNSVKGNTL